MFQGHHGIITGDTIVRGVAHSHEPHTHILGLLYGPLHTPDADGSTQSPAPVDKGSGCCLTFYRDLRSRQHLSCLQSSEVASQSRHPMGPYPPQIRLDEDISSHLGIRRRYVYSLEDLTTKGL